MIGAQRATCHNGRTDVRNKLERSLRHHFSIHTTLCCELRNYILKNLPFRRYQFWGRNRPSAATTFPTSLMSLTCSPMRWDFPLILRHFTEPPYLHVAGSFKAVLLEVQFILFRSSHYFSICAEFVCRLHCSFSPSLPPSPPGRLRFKLEHLFSSGGLKVGSKKARGVVYLY